MDWTSIITTAMIVLLGSGGLVVTVLGNSKKHDKKHDNIDEELKKILTELKNARDEIDDVKDQLRNNNYATKKQIKYTLTRLHRECIGRGCITRYELECAEDLYTEYQRLDGNSFVDRVMEDLRALPIKFVDIGIQEEQ
jgi:hypothetical protein